MGNSIAPAPPGAKGFDTDTQLNSASAAHFAAAGFVFAIRYLSLGSTESSSDLTSAEAGRILRAGLALMPVQHVRNPGWMSTGPLGHQYGSNAAAHARGVGFPPGVNIWVDLEGVSQAAASSDVIAFCNAWWSVVSAAGYLPGVYVGSNAVLSGEQLHDALAFQYYWKSGSYVPDIAVRGYCMKQTIGSTFTLNGISYDLDVVQTDNLGNTPHWWFAATGVSAAT